MEASSSQPISPKDQLDALYKELQSVKLKESPDKKRYEMVFLKFVDGRLHFEDKSEPSRIGIRWDKSTDRFRSVKSAYSFSTNAEKMKMLFKSVAESKNELSVDQIKHFKWLQEQYNGMVDHVSHGRPTNKDIKNYKSDVNFDQILADKIKADKIEVKQKLEGFVRDLKQVVGDYNAVEKEQIETLIKVIQEDKEALDEETISGSYLQHFQRLIEAYEGTVEEVKKGVQDHVGDLVKEDKEERKEEVRLDYQEPLLHEAVVVEQQQEEPIAQAASPHEQVDKIREKLKSRLSEIKSEKSVAAKKERELIGKADATLELISKNEEIEAELLKQVQEIENRDFKQEALGFESSYYECIQKLDEKKDIIANLQSVTKVLETLNPLVSEEKQREIELRLNAIAQLPKEPSELTPKSTMNFIQSAKMEVEDLPRLQNEYESLLRFSAETDQDLCKKYNELQGEITSLYGKHKDQLAVFPSLVKMIEDQSTEKLPENNDTLEAVQKSQGVLVKQLETIKQLYRSVTELLPLCKLLHEMTSVCSRLSDPAKAKFSEIVAQVKKEFVSAEPSTGFSESQVGILRKEQLPAFIASMENLDDLEVLEKALFVKEYRLENLVKHQIISLQRDLFDHLLKTIDPTTEPGKTDKHNIELYKKTFSRTARLNPESLEFKEAVGLLVEEKIQAITKEVVNNTFAQEQRRAEALNKAEETSKQLGREFLSRFGELKTNEVPGRQWLLGKLKGVQATVDGLKKPSLEGFEEASHRVKVLMLLSHSVQAKENEKAYTACLEGMGVVTKELDQFHKAGKLWHQLQQLNKNVTSKEAKDVLADAIEDIKKLFDEVNNNEGKGLNNLQGSIKEKLKSFIPALVLAIQDKAELQQIKEDPLVQEYAGLIAANQEKIFQTKTQLEELHSSSGLTPRSRKVLVACEEYFRSDTTPTPLKVSQVIARAIKDEKVQTEEDLVSLLKVAALTSEDSEKINARIKSVQVAKEQVVTLQKDVQKVKEKIEGRLRELENPTSPVMTHEKQVLDSTKESLTKLEGHLNVEEPLSSIEYLKQVNAEIEIAEDILSQETQGDFQDIDKKYQELGKLLESLKEENQLLEHYNTALTSSILHRESASKATRITGDSKVVAESWENVPALNKTLEPSYVDFKKSVERSHDAKDRIELQISEVRKEREALIDQAQDQWKKNKEAALTAKSEIQQQLSILQNDRSDQADILRKQLQNYAIPDEFTKDATPKDMAESLTKMQEAKKTLETLNQHTKNLSVVVGMVENLSTYYKLDVSKDVKALLLRGIKELNLLIQNSSPEKGISVEDAEKLRASSLRAAMLKMTDINDVTAFRKVQSSVGENGGIDAGSLDKIEERIISIEQNRVQAEKNYEKRIQQLKESVKVSENEPYAKELEEYLNNKVAVYLENTKGNRQLFSKEGFSLDRAGEIEKALESVDKFRSTILERKDELLKVIVPFTEMVANLEAYKIELQKFTSFFGEQKEFVEFLNNITMFQEGIPRVIQSVLSKRSDFKNTMKALKENKVHGEFLELTKQIESSLTLCTKEIRDHVGSLQVELQPAFERAELLQIPYLDIQADIKKVLTSKTPIDVPLAVSLINQKDAFIEKVNASFEEEQKKLFELLNKAESSIQEYGQQLKSTDLKQRIIQFLQHKVAALKSSTDDPVQQFFEIRAFLRENFEQDGNLRSDIFAPLHIFREVRESISRRQDLQNDIKNAPSRLFSSVSETGWWNELSKENISKSLKFMNLHNIQLKLGVMEKQFENMEMKNFGLYLSNLRILKGVFDNLLRPPTMKAIDLEEQRRQANNFFGVNGTLLEKLATFEVPINSSTYFDDVIENEEFIGHIRTPLRTALNLGEALSEKREHLLKSIASQDVRSIKKTYENPKIQELMNTALVIEWLNLAILSLISKRDNKDNIPNFIASITGLQELMAQFDMGKDTQEELKEILKEAMNPS